MTHYPQPNSKSFNNLIEDEDDLGDALFGSADDFKSRMSYLEGDALKKFTDELMAQEIIDGSTFEDEN